MQSAYFPRIIDAAIEHALRAVGAVVLEGARACGKTATGQHHASSEVRLDVDDDARALATIEPDLVLDGPTPRLIDEWQLEPRIWNRVRRAVDDRGVPGQFILTGSATPADDITRHSGAGRIIRMRMRPMSLFESGQSSGAVSLRSVMDNAAIAAARVAASVRDIADWLCVGGWPGLRRATAADARLVLASYLDDVARVDLPAVDGLGRRDPARVRRLLASLARNTATEVSMAALARDTGDDGQPLSVDAVRAYLAALERVMIIEDQPSWAPHLRSRDAVRQSAKRHFTDPSLAAAALGASPDRLIKDPNTFGLLFESLAVRDLRIYAQALGGEVRHYRDSAGTEADAIVTLPDGRWLAIEVKLAASQADAASRSLDAFVAKLDIKRTGQPVARLVVTAGEYAYTREDGVIVAPLAALGP